MKYLKVAAVIYLNILAGAFLAAVAVGFGYVIYCNWVIGGIGLIFLLAFVAFTIAGQELP